MPRIATPKIAGNGFRFIRSAPIRTAPTSTFQAASTGRFLRRRVINPGDLIVGDADGVVVVEREKREAMLCWRKPNTTMSKHV